MSFVRLSTDASLAGPAGVKLVASLIERYRLDEGEVLAALRKATDPPEAIAVRDVEGFTDPRLDSELARVEHDYKRMLQALQAELEDGKRVTGERIAAAHAAFAARHIGPDALTKLQRDVARTVVGLPIAGDDARDFVRFAFEHGAVEARREQVTKAEPELDVFGRAASWVRRRAAQAIVGLGNRLGYQFETLAIDTEHTTREELRARIGEQVSESVTMRETVKKLASNIGHAIKDWARDLLRISRTEMQTAHQAGWAANYQATTGPATRVAKRLDPQACKDCRRLFLDADGMPKIFLLADLQANGTNVGKKRADWLPTVGPVHPHCHCQLIRVPPGFGFDDQGRMVPL